MGVVDPVGGEGGLWRGGEGGCGGECGGGECGGSECGGGECGGGEGGGGEVSSVCARAAALAAPAEGACDTASASATRACLAVLASASATFLFTSRLRVFLLMLLPRLVTPAASMSLTAMVSSSSCGMVRPACALLQCEVMLYDEQQKGSGFSGHSWQLRRRLVDGMLPELLAAQPVEYFTSPTSLQVVRGTPPFSSQAQQPGAESVWAEYCSCSCAAQSKQGSWRCDKRFGVQRMW